MGDWITVSQLKERYPASRVSDLSGADDSVVETAIEAAEGQVRSRLSRRYTAAQLPAAGEAPEALRRIVAKLALYELSARHPNVSDDAFAQRKAAMTELDDIAAGGYGLGLADAPAVDLPAGEVVIITRSDDAADGTEGLTLENLRGLTF